MNMLDLVRDKVTGFQGHITARCEYLNGTTQFLVETPAIGGMEEPKTLWLDAKRLEVITPAGVTV